MTTPHRCPHGGTAEEMCDLCEEVGREWTQCEACDGAGGTMQPKATPEQAAPDEVFVVVDKRNGRTICLAPSLGVGELCPHESIVRYVKAQRTAFAPSNVETSPALYGPRAAVGSQEGAVAGAESFRDVMTPGVSQSAAPSCDRDVADGALSEEVSPELADELAVYRKWLDDPYVCHSEQATKRIRGLIDIVIRESKRGDDHLDAFNAAAEERDRLRARERELSAELTDSRKTLVKYMTEQGAYLLSSSEENVTLATRNLELKERAEAAEARARKLEAIGRRALSLFESDRPYAAFAVELRAALETK